MNIETNVVSEYQNCTREQLLALLTTMESTEINLWATIDELASENEELLARLKKATRSLGAYKANRTRKLASVTA